MFITSELWRNTTPIKIGSATFTGVVQRRRYGLHLHGWRNVRSTSTIKANLCEVTRTAPVLAKGKCDCYAAAPLQFAYTESIRIMYITRLIKGCTWHIVFTICIHIFKKKSLNIIIVQYRKFYSAGYTDTNLRYVKSALWKKRHDDNLYWYDARLCWTPVESIVGYWVGKLYRAYVKPCKRPLWCKTIKQFKIDSLKE